MKRKVIRRHLDAARELELLAKELRSELVQADKQHKKYIGGSDFLRGYYAGQCGAYMSMKYQALWRARQIRGGK